MLIKFFMTYVNTEKNIFSQPLEMYLEKLNLHLHLPSCKYYMRSILMCSLTNWCIDRRSIVIDVSNSQLPNETTNSMAWGKLKNFPRQKHTTLSVQTTANSRHSLRENSKLYRTHTNKCYTMLKLKPKHIINHISSGKPANINRISLYINRICL